MDVSEIDSSAETARSLETQNSFGDKVSLGFKGTKIVFHIMTGAVLIVVLGYWITPKLGFQKKIKSWWLGRICQILNLQVEVKGDYDPSASLLVSNHISWLDIAVIGGQLPIKFLSKDEVRSWPVIGWLAASTGTVFIKRGGGRSAQVAEVIADELSSGHSVLVFPEATSTDGRDVKRFFPAMFAAPLQANVRVQPIAIRYSEEGCLSDKAPFIGDDEFLSHLIGLLKGGEIRVEVQLLDSIHPHEMPDDKKKLSHAARERIVTALT